MGISRFPRGSRSGAACFFTPRERHVADLHAAGLEQEPLFAAVVARSINCRKVEVSVRKISSSLRSGGDQHGR
jgi:hypothetical protein